MSHPYIGYSHLVTSMGFALHIAMNPKGVCLVTFKETDATFIKQVKDTFGVVPKRDDVMLKEAKSKFEAYFAKELKSFALPLDITQGSAFQKSVWQALATIPYGQTRSYADIAQQIGNPKAVRAVGAANGKNPLPILLPCHRVIGKNGQLCGFGGGLDVKKWLLTLEGV